MRGLSQKIIGLGIFVIATTASQPSWGVRVKELVQVKGVRSNQLIGYGLVIGLAGTGDRQRTEFTTQSLTNMLKKLGIAVDPNSVAVRNVASVIVTATLPPFARIGQRIDIMVSSLGDAKSLKGGTLLLTPLRAPNNMVYAVAQGPLVVGGFDISQQGTSVTKNHPTVGKIPNGAIVEREVKFAINQSNRLTLMMNRADFTTAQRIMTELNKTFNENIAAAIDSRTISVNVPKTFKNNIVDFMAQIEGINVEPDSSAKVVLNERTGTVVVGENVRISTVAISHGNLSIQISEEYKISQPNALSQNGQTVVVPDSDISAKEEQGKTQLKLVPAGSNINDVVEALNAIGVTPRDMITIFQAIKAAGALQAEIEIM